jgi:hypothetical protein
MAQVGAFVRERMLVPSDAATESLFVPEGNPKNEIARFRTLRSQILAIVKTARGLKTDSRSAA